MHYDFVSEWMVSQLHVKWFYLIRVYLAGLFLQPKAEVSGKYSKLVHSIRTQAGDGLDAGMHGQEYGLDSRGW